MINHHPKSNAITAMLVVALLGLGVTPKLLAQNGDPNKQQRAVPTVSGKGTMAPAKTLAGGPPPPALPAAEKQKLLKGKQANVYAKLTVNQPYIFKKGALAFFGATQINAGEGDYGNIAIWPGKSLAKLEQSLLISLNPTAAGQLYALDIAVRGGTKGDTFTITGADGHKELFTATGDSQHLLIFVKADDPTEDQITVTGSSSWTFYSCEITAM